MLSDSRNGSRPEETLQAATRHNTVDNMLICGRDDPFAGCCFCFQLLRAVAAAEVGRAAPAVFAIAV